jgi:hypothetical protein
MIIREAALYIFWIIFSILPRVLIRKFFKKVDHNLQQDNLNKVRFPRQITSSSPVTLKTRLFCLLFFSIYVISITIPKDSMKILRRRLRKCTKRLLQVAWQKHKTIHTWGFQRQSFWNIPEAQSVLFAWRASKLTDSDSFEGDVAFNTAEFLKKAEFVAHPGKSSLFKHHRYSAVHQVNALAADVLQQLAAKVPQLQFKADTLVGEHESRSSEVAALLKEVD